MLVKTYGFYFLAAFGEIAGCFAFWAWLRLDKSPIYLIPGMASLAAFAYFLTRIDTDAAGRAYAACGPSRGNGRTCGTSPGSPCVFWAGP